MMNLKDNNTENFMLWLKCYQNLKFANIEVYMFALTDDIIICLL